MHYPKHIRGATPVEYGVLAAFISIGSMAALTPLGQQVGSKINYVAHVVRADEEPSVPPPGSIVGTPQDDILNGTSGDDVIYGLEANDTIDGGYGADAMYGGPGDDHIWIWDPLAQPIEHPNEGTDAISARISWTLGPNFENLHMRGAYDNDGTGNELDNYITGNSGHNTLNGMGGNDLIIGHDGNDIIIGGPGNDHLTGIAHADTFRFWLGDGQDIITDFNTSYEVLEIYGYSGYQELRQESGGTLVVLSGSDTIMLQGVSSTSLTGTNIQFL